MSNAKQTSGDSDDLEALFDSIVSAGSDNTTAAAEDTAAKPVPKDSSSGSDEKVFSQIGHLTRKLHDTLQELGYDKTLEKVAKSVPDTTDRLNYIATLT